MIYCNGKEVGSEVSNLKHIYVQRSCMLKSIGKSIDLSFWMLKKTMITDSCRRVIVGSLSKHCNNVFLVVFALMPLFSYSGQ